MTKLDFLLRSSQKTAFAFIGMIVFLTACTSSQEANSFQQDPLVYVNPFVGTGGHGHTYPGASSPFGMVQLSPDTRLIGWDGCSGYHYTDSVIYGFSHTHLSGTGVSDYGDILLMPVNNAMSIKDGKLPYKDFQSSFSHDTESATAGFYSVHLDQPDVAVALATTPRTGAHQYRFNNPQEPGFVLDLEHRDEVLACDIQIVGANRIEGYRHSKAWADDQRVFFVMEFSESFTSHELKVYQKDKDQKNTTHSKGIFLFPKRAKEFLVKVAISAVDLEGARKNFDGEIKDFSFAEIKKQNEDLWRKELTKIEAVSLSEDEQTIFYSALYHTMLAPNIYNDIDGRYRGMDQKVYQDSKHDHYTVFSLWDTHRAAHPLYTITDQKRTNDFIHTMLRKYEQGGILPIWDLSACYTGCMIGYHGVSVIADAQLKGIGDFDGQQALQAMAHSARQDHLGLRDYKENGFIAVQNEPESVSKNLEYSYDDWCIAQMAKDQGNNEMYQEFLDRSLNYRNSFDPDTKFFRPRRYNAWESPFDPYEVNSNYTEANAWHYGFSAVHDMQGFIGLHGGNEAFGRALDDLFAASSQTKGRDQVDITGLIGQYAHGNEPSHHISYLYNYIGQAWKTQEKVRDILSSQYQNAPDGVSGNEDCGQMSAWYIFSALGFYPALPGSTQYLIGSPAVQEAKVNLENGKHFEITTANNSSRNKYIQSITLNGKAYDKTYLEHEVIMNGGQLHFEMGPQPNKDWGKGEASIDLPAVKDEGFVATPFIAAGQLSFSEKNTIKLSTLAKGDQIYYQINNGLFQKYEGLDIVLEESAKLCLFSQRNQYKSDTLCTDFIKIDGSISLDLKSAFASIYNGGSPTALIDGLRGTKDYRTGGWQGFEGKDLECTIDLSKVKNINQVSCSFLQDENSWIFFPSEVAFYASSDNKNFQLLGQQKPNTAPQEKGTWLENIGLNLNGVKARYIKIKAKSLIKCPDWHKGALYDGKAWVFADEIMIN